MTNESQTPPAGKPTGRGLRIALALSVALNLAGVGVIAGAYLREGHRAQEMMSREMGFGPFAEALRPEDRKALRRDLFARAPEMRKARKQMRADAAEILQALRADPFEASALETLMDKQQARLATQLQLGQELIRDFLVAMPLEERKAFADRLERSLRRGPDPKP